MPSFLINARTFGKIICLSMALFWGQQAPFSNICMKMYSKFPFNVIFVIHGDGAIDLDKV